MTDDRPDATKPGTPRTLRGVLDELAERGYDGDAAVAEHGRVRCLSCDTVSSADEVEFDSRSRIEGASDPADNAVVLAFRCPACDARAALVARYGPEASADEADLLASTRGRLPEVDEANGEPGR